MMSKRVLGLSLVGLMIVGVMLFVTHATSTVGGEEQPVVPIEILPGSVQFYENVAAAVLKELDKYPLHRFIVQNLPPANPPAQVQSIQKQTVLTMGGAKQTVVTAPSDVGTIKAVMTVTPGPKTLIEFFLNNDLRVSVTSEYGEDDGKLTYTVAYKFFHRPDWNFKIIATLLSDKGEIPIKASFVYEIGEKRFEVTTTPFTSPPSTATLLVAPFTAAIESTESTIKKVIEYAGSLGIYDPTMNLAVGGALYPDNWRTEFEVVDSYRSSPERVLAKKEWHLIAKFLISAACVVGSDAIGTVGATIITGASNIGGML